MKAMIFAAGFGKRLHPLTKHLPKPLIRVKNKPILNWIIEQLLFYQINEAVINLHYLADKIIQHLEGKQKKIKFRFSLEKTIMGTGGGLFNTVDYWDDKDFYLCNSDILCNANLNHFFSFHANHSALATLAVNRQDSNSMLLVDESRNLVGIRRNGEDNLLKRPEGTTEPVGFCGLHVINPKIFKHFDSPAEFSIIDEYLKIISKGQLIKTWDIGDAYWVDIGSQEGLENADRHFPGFGF